MQSHSGHHVSSWPFDTCETFVTKYPKNKQTSSHIRPAAHLLLVLSKMKVAAILILLAHRSSSFVPLLVPARSSSSQLRHAALVELEPEPAGGEELTATTTLPGCRMKQMGPAVQDTSNVENKGLEVFEFWMTAEADGALFQEIRTQLLKDASRKANFPGFRKVCMCRLFATLVCVSFLACKCHAKSRGIVRDSRTHCLRRHHFWQGQVPPYAMPQITRFSVQESIIKTVEAAVQAFGLKSLAGSDGEVNVKEDVQEIASKIQMGDSIPFTATLCAAFAETTSDSSETAVDAPVTSE